MKVQGTAPLNVVLQLNMEADPKGRGMGDRSNSCPAPDECVGCGLLWCSLLGSSRGPATWLLRGTHRTGCKASGFGKSGSLASKKRTHFVRHSLIPSEKSHLAPILAGACIRTLVWKGRFITKAPLEFSQVWWYGPAIPALRGTGKRTVRFQANSGLSLHGWCIT